MKYWKTSSTTQQALVKSTEAIVKTDQAQIDVAKLDLVYCHITSRFRVVWAFGWSIRETTLRPPTLQH